MKCKATALKEGNKINGKMMSVNEYFIMELYKCKVVDTSNNYSNHDERGRLFQFASKKYFSAASTSTWVIQCHLYSTWHNLQPTPS